MLIEVVRVRLILKQSIELWGEKLAKSGQIGFYILKYFISPLLLLIGIFTLTSAVGGRLSGAETSLIAYIESAFTSSLLLWFPIFFLITLFIVINLGVNWARKKDRESRNKTSIFRISIKTRIYLKKYLLMISLGMFLIFFALYVHNYNYLKGQLQLSLEDFPVFFVSFTVGSMLFYVYLAIYTQEEKAIYFLDRFLRQIGLSDNTNRRYVNSKDFEIALQAYQKSMVTNSYCLKDVRAIRIRIDLVLDRGNPEDLTKLQLYLRSLSDFIKIQDANSFDLTLSEISKFLIKKEWSKMDIIKVKTSSDNELFTSSFKKGLSENLGKTAASLVVILFGLIIWLLFGFPVPSWL